MPTEAFLGLLPLVWLWWWWWWWLWWWEWSGKSYLLYKLCWPNIAIMTQNTASCIRSSTAHLNGHRHAGCKNWNQSAWEGQGTDNWSPWRRDSFHVSCHVTAGLWTHFDTEREDKTRVSGVCQWFSRVWEKLRDKQYNKYTSKVKIKKY